MTKQQGDYDAGTHYTGPPLIQPTPNIVIEQVTQRHYVLRHTTPFKLYLTEAELRAVHLFAGDTCGSDCACYERGFQAGQDAGNLRSRA